MKLLFKTVANDSDKVYKPKQIATSIISSSHIDFFDTVSRY